MNEGQVRLTKRLRDGRAVWAIMCAPRHRCNSVDLIQCTVSILSLTFARHGHCVNIHSVAEECCVCNPRENTGTYTDLERRRRVRWLAVQVVKVPAKQQHFVAQKATHNLVYICNHVFDWFYRPNPRIFPLYDGSKRYGKRGRVIIYYLPIGYISQMIINYKALFNCFYNSSGQHNHQRQHTHLCKNHR